ncbi:hypothetical protein FJ987_23410 [Mesorhizobium sp. CU2]|nr:hypothetical protein FJ987_23410 [Mesorhizobium sp. CU2]
MVVTRRTVIQGIPVVVGIPFVMLDTRQSSGAAAASWPDSSSTGTNGALIAVPGAATSGPGWVWDSVDHYIKVTGAGVTLSNLDSSGSIWVLADKVNISNCRVTCADMYGIYSQANDTTVVNCQVVGPGGAAGAAMSGIVSSNANGFTVRRCEVSGVTNGLFLSGLNAVIEDNYIHDLVSEDVFGDPDAENAPHTDGCQLCGGECDGTVIRHNNIISPAISTSAIIMGAGTNIKVDNNRLRGGSYTLYTWSDRSNSYTNNRLAGGHYGLATSNDDSRKATFTGNVNDDTGAPVGLT